MRFETCLSQDGGLQRAITHTDLFLWSKSHVYLPGPSVFQDGLCQKELLDIKDSSRPIFRNACEPLLLLSVATVNPTE